jgi:hypothetical protein
LPIYLTVRPAVSRRLLLAPLVIAVATGTAACGSKGAAPATQTMGASRSALKASVPRSSGSVPLSSPAFRNALIRELAKHKQIRTKLDGPWADCVIARLRSEGFRTVGDARSHTVKLRAAGIVCARHVILGLT